MAERTECRSCGQTFASPREAEDHDKQMHAAKKDGDREAERREDVAPKR